MLNVTRHIGNENITLSSPQPVCFILPCLLKNIRGLVYNIIITTNIYNIIDIYKGFCKKLNIAIIQIYQISIK